MEKQVEEFKDKVHNIIDGLFDVSCGMSKLIENVQDLFPKEENKVIDLKVIRNENDEHKKNI